MKKGEEELFTDKSLRVTMRTWEFNHVKTYQGTLKREGIAMRWMLSHGSQLEGLFISGHFPNYNLGQNF